MNYWLDLFTGTTWREFLNAGGTVSGFREKQRKLARRLQPGDKGKPDFLQKTAPYFAKDEEE